MDIVVTIQRNLKVEVENPAYQKKKIEFIDSKTGNYTQNQDGMPQ